MNAAKEKRQEKAIVQAYHNIIAEKSKDESTLRKEKLQKFIDLKGKDALVLVMQEKQNGYIVCSEFSWAYDAKEPEQLDNARILRAETLMEIYIMQDDVFSKNA